MRLLIADDEDYTREGLIESIHWADYGINEIKQARDGNEALQISIWFKPDIVLTDIKMPKLNGIEFAEKLIKQCPNSKLLFMSSYLDTDYLKSAIKLAAIDYIEKPINLIAVENAVKKAIGFIDEKRKQNLSNVEKKELQMQKLAKMLRNRNNRKEIINPVCEEIGYPMNSNYIAIVLWDEEKLLSEEESISKINNFWGLNGNKSICAYIEDSKYFTIIKLKDKEVKNIKLLCGRLAEQMKSFRVGIGFQVKNLMDVPESYETAMLNVNSSFYNLDKRVFAQENKIISAKNLDTQLYSQLSSVMKDTPKELLKWMEGLFNRICEMECYKKENLQKLFLTFAEAIIQDKKDIITKMDNMYNEDDVERYIMNTTTIYQIKDFMFKLINEYQREIESDFKYSKLIRDVIHYINSHYTEADLGIEDIAKYMHFSSAHLSVLFKHEFGVTIKQYISDYRLELSKKMLVNEHYKINEIAELCGYSNANYFAKVFKVATNQSPVEYRKTCGVV